MPKTTPIVLEGYVTIPSAHRNELYYYACGNPNGVPVLIFHGGPGYFSTADDVLDDTFDHNVFFLIAFDQRGCGRSKPPAYAMPFDTFLEGVSLRDIARDGHTVLLHALKRHRQCSDDSNKSAVECVVHGCSWGSAAALAYVIEFPKVVRGVMVQGIYTGTKEEHRWLFDVVEQMRLREGGAHHPEVIAECILRKFLCPIVGVEDVPGAMLNTDSLVAHERVRDFVMSVAPLQKQGARIDFGPWKCASGIVMRNNGSEDAYPVFNDSCGPCQCSRSILRRPTAAPPSTVECCCVEMAHRVLALWSQFENLLTYPDEATHYLNQMQASSDMSTPYRASHKDVTGGLMQLILFPTMMRRKQSLVECLQERWRALKQPLPSFHVIVGEEDRVCPPTAAQTLFNAVVASSGVTGRVWTYKRGKCTADQESNEPSKRREGNIVARVWLHRCPRSSHDVVEDLEIAMRRAAAVMAEDVLQF